MVEKFFNGRTLAGLSNEATFQDVDDERVVIFGTLCWELDRELRVDDRLDLLERVPDMTEG